MSKYLVGVILFFLSCNESPTASSKTELGTETLISKEEIVDQDVRPNPKCLYKSEICLGSSIRSIREDTNLALYRPDSSYQHRILRSSYRKFFWDKRGRDTLPIRIRSSIRDSIFYNVEIMRMIDLKTDESEQVVAYKVQFFCMDYQSYDDPEYWTIFTEQIGINQFEHYIGDNLPKIFDAKFRYEMESENCKVKAYVDSIKYRSITIEIEKI